MTMLGTIVIADDEALARQSVAEVLREEGYQVYEAADGREALQLLEEVDVDLILNEDKKSAAELLGLSLSSLYRKLDEFGIQRDTR